MNRRSLLKCSCAISTPLLHAAEIGPINACCISDEAFTAIVTKSKTNFSTIWENSPILFSSGNIAFDRALGRSLVRLAKEFRVFPAFGYINDRLMQNAIATTATRVGSTRGTVLFELNFLFRFLDHSEGGDAIILGICAHEFGHISQFFGGPYKRLRESHKTVKLVELHADYLSGYFMSIIKRERPNIRLRAFGETMHHLGGYETESPDFHGKPDERLQALEKGFFSGPSFNGFDQATATGVQYIIENFS